MIVYTNSGAGHRRAAEALNAECDHVFSNATVRLIDVLDYATPVFRRLYPEIYLFMVNHLPWLWGFNYYLLDLRPIAKLARLFRRATNRRHCREFERLIRTEQPDLVLTTHWLPNEIISSLKKKEGFQTKLVTCITDYYPHAFWRDVGVDLYITASDELTPRLNRLGIDNERIMVGGIPIDSVFSHWVDKRELYQQLGLDPQRFTVLMASGGFGVGPVEAMVEELLKVDLPLQVMVVCGKNTKLQMALKQMLGDAKHRFHIYGFVRNMHELMTVSDLMISKSGGLTTSEAMAKELPMIILYPIPGQERSNCRFMVNHGAGVRARNAKEARAVVEELISQPQKLERMKMNLRRLAKPKASREVLQYIKNRFGGEEDSDGIKPDHC